MKWMDPARDTISSPSHAQNVERPETEVNACESWSAWALKGPFAVALTVLALGQLIFWIPHYLTWPLFTDHDVFATAAYAWDHGLRPYHDIRGNNFPGTVYLFWMLGKTFGWGKSVPFYAFDAALLVAFGALLVAWSLRRFGKLLPALAGYLTVLAYYLSLDYSQAGQRDWHAPLLMCASLLALQCWPRRLGWPVSLILAAAALTIRPQAALLLPAALLTLHDQARRPAQRLTSVFPPILLWCASLLALLTLAFTPLIASGVHTDFLQSIRMVCPGGTYSMTNLTQFRAELIRELAPVEPWGIVLTMLLLFHRVRPEFRRLTLIWLVAAAGILLYKPLSPVPHAYLAHPMRLVGAVEIAVLVGLVLEADALAASVRVAMVILVLGLGANVRPRFCNLSFSLDAVTLLRHSQTPLEAPPGYTRNLDVRSAAAYSWTAYRDTIEYLKHSTKPGTRVANLLKDHPAVTGPAGRLPLFPAESIAWIRLIRTSDEPDFARALQQPGDAVVVWSPGEADSPRAPKLSTLFPLIPQFYEREAAFGAIEVWRRRPDPTPLQTAASDRRISAIHTSDMHLKKSRQFP